jgi:hypothetical protein
MTVIEAVVRVLREAERPIRAREILALVEQIKGESVSWSWVKGCLSLNCSGPSARFQRVERGLYGLSR